MVHEENATANNIDHLDDHDVIDDNLQFEEIILFKNKGGLRGVTQGCTSVLCTGAADAQPCLAPSPQLWLGYHCVHIYA